MANHFKYETDQNRPDAVYLNPIFDLWDSASE